VGDTWVESTPTFTQQQATLAILGGDVMVEAHQNVALVSCDLGNLTATRIRFVDGAPRYPYIIDADGGAVTEATFDATVAEE